MKGVLPQIIADHIVTDFIRGRNLEVGARLPTVRQIADFYQTSVETAFGALRVLADQGMIHCRRGSGSYVARPYAEASCTESRHLGLVSNVPVYDENPLAGYFQQGVRARCDMLGIKLTAETGASGYADEKKTVRRLLKAGCKVLIISPATRTRSQLRSDYLAKEFRDVPIVLYGFVHEEQNRPAVLFDNRRAARLITSRLVANGYRHVVFSKLQSARDELCHRSNEDRYDGYLDALSEFGLPPRTMDIEEAAAKEQLGEEAARWFAANRALCDGQLAILARDDMHARVLIAAARRAGLRLPGNLLVAGFDNLPGSPRIFPTTAPDFRMAGEMTVDIALQQLNRPTSVACHYLLPVPILWGPDRSPHASEI